jgi:C-terminal processing protease CtpA/Prc
MFKIRSVSILLALLLTSSLAHGLDWKRPADGKCPEGHPLTGDLGIGHLRCRGGACAVNEKLRSGGYVHTFSTEPQIVEVAADGPAAGRLQKGDMLTAIDGVLITTREGGRHLANLTPGEAVTLTVRRAGAEMDVEVVPVRGCNMPSLTVTGGRDDVTVRDGRAPARSVDFGMELECSDCGWHTGPDGRKVWRASSFPKVRSVEPGGPAALAGIRPGDVLLEIDGYSFIEKAAGEHLGELRPGQRTTLKIGRVGVLRNVVIVPRAKITPRRL